MSETTVFAQVAPLLANITEPTRQSTLTTFFHNYPRWLHDSTFTLTTNYYISIGLLALPYVLFGVLFITTILITNACLRKRNPDHASGQAMGKSGLLGASTIYLFAFVCLGIGLVANDSFHNFVRAINQVISGFIDAFGVAGLGVLQFVTSARNDLLTGDIAPYADRLLEPLDEGVGMAQRLTEQVTAGIEDARGVINGVDKAITWIYVVLIVVFLFLFVGLVLLFSSGVRGNVRRRVAKAIYLMPLLLAWITVGIATSTGAVLGDMCFTLADYQKSILVDKGMLPPSTMDGMNMSNNAMAQTEIKCPQDVFPERDLETLSNGVDRATTLVQTLVNQVENAPPAIQAVVTLVENQLVNLPEDAKGEMDSALAELSRAITWVREQKNEFLDCNQLAELLARLNAYLCGPRQTIMVVFSIWLALFLLAILLSVMLILASFTRFNPAMFVTPRWVATERGTYVTASKKLVISPSEFSPYFEATAPAPTSFMTVDKNSV